MYMCVFFPLLRWPHWGRSILKYINKLAPSFLRSSDSLKHAACVLPGPRFVDFLLLANPSICCSPRGDAKPLCTNKKQNLLHRCLSLPFAVGSAFCDLEAGSLGPPVVAAKRSGLTWPDCFKKKPVGANRGASVGSSNPSNLFNYNRKRPKVRDRLKNARWDLIIAPQQIRR